MSFSAELQYAIIILHKVRQFSKSAEPVTMEMLVEEYGLALEFLYKVARKLRKGGYLKAVKGPGGGYIADKDLTEVEFWSLYETVAPGSAVLKLALDPLKAKVVLDLHKEFAQHLEKLKI